MQENVDKKIDHLVKKMMNNVSVETPSFNFTDSVMSQVNAIESSDVTVYKPLISKNIWVFILIGFCVLLGYLIFGAETEGLSWFSAIDFNVLSSNRLFEALSGFAVSKTLLYAISFFGLMMCIQIPLLKSYFDKRFEV